MLEFNGTFFVQVGIVIVFMIAINHLVFRPLAALRGRREGLVGDLGTSVASLERQREALLAEYQRKLAEERQSLLQLRQTARAEIDQEKSKIIQTAREKANIILKKEVGDLKADRDAVRESLRADTRALAEAVFTRLAGRAPSGKC
jgi:F0F1-type ATP synthase membrane subunit b/b'